MKRRRRKNPAPLLWLLGAGVLAFGGAVAFVVTRKSASSPAPSKGAAAAIPPAQAAAGATVALNASDCAAMRNGTLATSQDDLDACDRLAL